MPSPAAFNPDQFCSLANLAQAFYGNADQGPPLVAYDQAVIDPSENPGDDARPRRYVETSQRQSADRVLKIAAHLEAWGVRPGEAIAVLSLDRPEWTEAEMAIHTVGARLVGAYVRDPLERLHHILSDSGANWLFVENQEQLDKVLGLTSRGAGKVHAGQPGLRALPPLALKGIVSFEDVDWPGKTGHASLRLASLREILAAEAVRDPQSFAWVDVRDDDVAAIFYTSASTGPAKGVAVTHRQTLENLRQLCLARLVDYEQLEAEKRQPFVTSVLPERAHAYSSRVAQLVATTPARGRFPPVVDRRSSQLNAPFREALRRHLLEGAAGIVVVVPKILVALHQRLLQRLAKGGWREGLAQRVLANATEKLLADARGHSRLGVQLQYAALTPLRERIVRHIRRQIVGPLFECFISGGAKLPPDTAALLGALGLPVYEGYGSTETNCPIAVGTPALHRSGSVGKPFPGIEVRVEPASGEILIRGPNIPRTYWRRPAESAAAWTDGGWYHTHDVGRVDADGFLYVHDRLDHILVLQNGEKVSATEIAGRFAAIAYVETAVVIGHERPGLVALVAVNDQVAATWAASRGLAAGDAASLRALLWADVEKHVNAQAGRPFERIRNVGLIPPLDTAEHTLTATEKVLRREIESRYAALIDRLYAECTFAAADAGTKAPAVFAPWESPGQVA